MFVTDGDLEISGNPDMHAEGQILIHEQIKLNGNIDLIGQITVEDAATVSSLVLANAISGYPQITYNGGLDSDVFAVTGWRDVRDAN